MLVSLLQLKYHHMKSQSNDDFSNSGQLCTVALKREVLDRKPQEQKCLKLGMLSLARYR